MITLDAPVDGKQIPIEPKLRLKVPPSYRLIAFDDCDTFTFAMWSIFGALFLFYTMGGFIGYLDHVMLRRYLSKLDLCYVIDDNGIALKNRKERDGRTFRQVLNWKSEKLVGYRVKPAGDHIKIIVKIQKWFFKFSREIFVSPDQGEMVKQQMLPILEAHIVAAK